MLKNSFSAWQPHTFAIISYAFSPNADFALLSLQNVDDDGQLSSSSEGSTIDGMAGADGEGSVELELEEIMEPDACFPDGEYFYIHHITYFSVGVKEIVQVF